MSGPYDICHGGEVGVIHHARPEPEPKAARSSQGRKPGTPVKFPGAAVFAAERGVTYQHVYRVLTGDRASGPLVAHFSEWLTERGMRWPDAAAVKPEGKGAGR